MTPNTYINTDGKIIVSTKLNKPTLQDTLNRNKTSTNTIYVSPNGDNTDGTSWEHAYTTLNEALDNVPNDYDTTLIELGTGIYDINLPGDPTWGNNFLLTGRGRTDTAIINNHASATSVLKFIGSAVLDRITIDCGTSNNGIIFAGAVGKMIQCVMIGLSATSNIILADFQNVPFLELDNSYFVGDTGGLYTTGLQIEGANISKMDDNNFWFGKYHLNLINVDNIVFYRHVFLDAGTMALTTDSDCSNLFFIDAQFINNTDNIDDSSEAFFNQEGTLIERETKYQIPAGADSGIIITGAAAVETYGDWIDIVSNIPNKFKVLDVSYHTASDANAIYTCQVGVGTAGNEIVLNTVSFAGDRKGGSLYNMFSGILCKNTRISIRCQTSNGGEDTIKSFIYVVDL